MAKTKKVTPKKSVAKKIAVKKSVVTKSVDDDETKRKKDWEYNDGLICSTFCDLLMENQKLPSTQAIADKCGLSHKTVDRHLKDSNSFENFKQRFRAGNEKVMLNLFRQAAVGNNVNMIRLWFEVTEGLGNKKQVDITSGGKKIEPVTNSVLLDPTKLTTEALKEILKQTNETTSS